jgi:penicillin-binding protein 1A
MGQKSFSSEEMQRYFSDPEYRRKYMKKRKKRFNAKHIIIYCLLLLLIGAAIWYWKYIVSGLPTLEQLENPRPELATKIYSSDGVVLDLLAYKNRMRISIDSVPPGLIQALLATEDKDFYSHWGVNLPRFVRQMALNVLTFQQAGASTITQQLSRNLYKLQGKNESLFDKVTRKIREFITAVQIERNFTKKEILELYLNVSYFGYNAYGIEAAAQTYFRKSASNLTMPEYTLLIGMLKGPSYYNPINHPERAFKRREVVLESMLRDGLITNEMAQNVKADSLDFRVNEAELRTGIAPHFVEMLRQTLSKKAEKYGFDIYRDGLQVYTTLDSRMQRYANQTIEEHLNGYQKLFDSTWNWSNHTDILNDNIAKAIQDNPSFKKAHSETARDSVRKALWSNSAFIDSVRRAAQTIETGFVVISPHTGEILAMVGGRNFRTFKYGLNHVTQIRRQPGSAFKPFVYTVAIDNGYPPCYEILNQPVTIPMPDGTRWAPENYERTIGGKYTLRDAIKFSVNLVTVRAVIEIAPPKQVAEYAHRMGVESPIPPYESIALGTPVVSPMEITTAYGVFANEGVLISPYSIVRIEDSEGNVIETTTPVKKEVLSRETAYIMTDMLKGVVNGGTATRGVRTYFNGPCAGKTGTTNDYADAWFIGFTPQLVAGAWLGFDDMRVKFQSGDGQGGRAAAPIFGRFMQKVYSDPSIDLPLEFFEQPPGVITDTICAETKKKARPYCPEKITEIFNVKYPISLCDKHTSPDWKQETDTTGNVRKNSKISW